MGMVWNFKALRPNKPDFNKKKEVKKYLKELKEYRFLLIRLKYL